MQRAKRFFDEAGIRLLADSCVRFKGVDVIGRDDAFNRKRAPLADLARGLDGFTLVLDHEPRDLEEAERAGVDFQFSGHTHRGQIWPVSWIVYALYEKSWGPHRRGATRYYVSSGLGIWGAKIRVGTRAEYLVLRLERAVGPAGDRPARLLRCPPLPHLPPPFQPQARRLPRLPAIPSRLPSLPRRPHPRHRIPATRSPTVPLLPPKTRKPQPPKT